MADAFEHTEAWKNTPEISVGYLPAPRTHIPSRTASFRCFGVRDKDRRVEELDEVKISCPVLQRQGVGQPTS